jgi:hypothetical protein
MILKRLQPGDCVLLMTGSTTSTGWLKKTNFSEAAMDPTESTIHLKIARKHASLFIYHNIKENSQWFLGKKNNIVDALSWDFDLSDAELTKTLCLHYPSQLPPHFQVVPLPREIESWLISLLLRLPVKEQLREQHMKTKLGPTDNGSNTLNQLASPTTPSLTDSTDANKTFSSAPLQQQSEKERFPRDAFKTLAAGTVRNTISSICVTPHVVTNSFQEWGLPMWEFFCLLARSGMGTPRMVMGIGVYAFP